MYARTLEANEDPKFRAGPLRVERAAVEALLVGAVFLKQQELAAGLRIDGHS